MINFPERLCKIQIDHLNNPDVIRESNTLFEKKILQKWRIRETN